jgi:hypothetical protein
LDLELNDGHNLQLGEVTQNLIRSIELYLDFAAIGLAIVVIVVTVVTVATVVIGPVVIDVVAESTIEVELELELA